MIFKLNTYLAIILLATTVVAKAQTVTIDNYFNHETKVDKNGDTINFHYLWDDNLSSGFSILGDSFKRSGAKKLAVLAEKPNRNNLKQTDVYIIVDPDNEKDNPKPNYIDASDAKVISNWVKKGGVLFILANDKANCDLEHLNILAQKFGIMFNRDLIMHVVNDQYFDDGSINTLGTEIFSTAKEIFIKDACSITANKKSNIILKDKNGANVMVSVKFGKGTVLAIGDPWLYNEYTNGRLPKKFENDKAANDVSMWLLKQIPANK